MESSEFQTSRKTGSNALADYKCSVNGASHAEYPAITDVAPTMQMHSSGPNDSFYNGPASIGYSDFPDRFSVGYQRMGQTITLTSHKIQFGCQRGRGHSSTSYDRQRFEEPHYRQHYHTGPTKAWADTSMEQTLPSVTKPHNRGRTTYSDEQIAELEGVFNSNPYPTAQTRQQLAFKIDVPEGKVKIWFQNRRARAKKVKLSCGWRMSHNESRISDDHNNQNNNNTKSDCRKHAAMDSFSISVNSLLPLPTKPIISANKWPGAACMHPWRTQLQNDGQQYRGHSCQIHDQSSCALMNHPYSSNQCESNTRMWNWAGAYTSQCCSDHCKADHGKEPKERRQNITTSWNSQQTFGNVPDLICKTSRVGLDDSVNSDTDGNLSTSSITANLPKNSEDASETATSGCFSRSNKATTSEESCAAVPTCSSSVYLTSQEKRSLMLNNEQKSPPPVRRLIFPFHTLTDVKTSRPDTGVMYYPLLTSKSSAVAENLSYSYPPKTYPVQSTSHFNVQGINLSGNYQPQPIIGSIERYPTNVPEFKLDPSTSYSQVQGPTGEKWSLPYYQSNICHIPETHEQTVKCETASEQVTAQRSRCNDEDDGETTDDAVDDVGLMEGINTEEGHLTNKSSYAYSAGDNVQNSAVCWQDRPSSNILIKAMEYNGDTHSNTKPIDGVNEGRLTSLTSGVLPAGEATGVWSNQLMGGIYPPVSASMVG